MSNDFHQFIPAAADHPRRSASALPDVALVADRNGHRLGVRSSVATALRAVANVEHRLATRIEPNRQPDQAACAPQCT